MVRIAAEDSPMHVPSICKSVIFANTLILIRIFCEYREYRINVDHVIRDAIPKIRIGE